jgi:hypothetical protein
VFWDEERGREDPYDFAQLELPDPISRAFAKAFKTITGAYRGLGRKQAWRHVTRFARFLKMDAAGVQKVLADPNLLIRYKADLLQRKVMRKTACGHYNFARQLLCWLIDNAENGPWQTAIIFRAPSMMSREAHNVRDNPVSPEQLRTIATHCKREIDLIMQRFTVRERVERGEEVSRSELGGISPRKFKEIIAFEAQGIYTQRDFNRVHRGGLAVLRLRRLEPFRALTVRNALPFYVLLIISTCGNPMGIKDLNIECLQPHPTDPLKRRISWNKHRARQQQAYDVMADGAYSAVRCVNDLLRLTKPIRKLATPTDAQKLMITRSGHRAKRISIQSLHNGLTVFRNEHSLPYFTFADLRKAAAVAIDQFVKSAAIVRKVLQHRSGRTTQVYLQARRSLDRRYEGVLRFQGQMLALAQTLRLEPRDSSRRATYETVTGLGCRNPLLGTAQGSVRDQACLQWLQCCRCPNAIVIRDDPAVVARIVRAAQSLNEMRLVAALSADATQHFEAVFRPTLHIIELQILPHIAESVRVQAQRLAASLPALPLLE